VCSSDLQALASVMPKLIGPDPHALALERLQALVAKALPPVPAAAAPAAAIAPADAPVPPRERIESVASGNGAFTREQRGWVIAECLALTGWQYTPLELIERGDAWMAQRMLGMGESPA